MPIYEYECDHCGDRIEILQRMGDPPKTECPRCHTHTLRKLVSAAGFRLKGTGWYETDFKTQPKKTQESQKESQSSIPHRKKLPHRSQRKRLRPHRQASLLPESVVVGIVAFFREQSTAPVKPLTRKQSLDLKNQIYLGSERFVEQMQARIGTGRRLDPRKQRRPIPKPLEYYGQRYRQRDRALAEAPSAVLTPCSRSGLSRGLVSLVRGRVKHKPQSRVVARARPAFEVAYWDAEETRLWGPRIYEVDFGWAQGLKRPVAAWRCRGLKWVGVPPG